MPTIPTLSRAPSCRRLPVSTKPIEDDIDVANERHRVLRGDADNDMLKIENLTKVQQQGSGGGGCAGSARRHLRAVPSEGRGLGLGVQVPPGRLNPPSPAPPGVQVPQDWAHPGRGPAVRGRAARGVLRAAGRQRRGQDDHLQDADGGREHHGRRGLR